MSLAVICCRVLEKEIRTLISSTAAVTHLEVMEWGLHAKPNLLLDALSERIRAVQDRVDAVFLGYGRCQTLDKLPRDFRVPVFYPEGEDCIGVLLGQARYAEELLKEAFTWFLTRGWAEMGTEFIFHELQLYNAAQRGIDPLSLAHKMLNDYKRALLIHVEAEPEDSLMEKARQFCEEFDMRLETTRGSLTALEQAFGKALHHCSRATR